MDIVKTNLLNEEQVQQVIELENKCFLRDGLENHAYLSNDLNYYQDMPCFFLGYLDGVLISFLTVFAPEQDQAEIKAVTDPLWERRGLFHRLFSEAIAEIRNVGISEVLLEVEKKSVSGNQLVQKLTNSEIDHIEYRMELLAEAKEPSKIAYLGRVERVTNYTKHLFRDIQEQANSRPEEESYLNTIAMSETRKGYLYEFENEYVGAFVIGHEENGVFIYGVAIKCEYQGKGIAKYMMRQAITLAMDGSTRIYLEVDSENPIALKLYQRCGFKPVFEVDYYRFQISPVSC